MQLFLIKQISLLQNPHLNAILMCSNMEDDTLLFQALYTSLDKFHMALSTEAIQPTGIDATSSLVNAIDLIEKITKFEDLKPSQHAQCGNNIIALATLTASTIPKTNATACAKTNASNEESNSKSITDRKTEEQPVEVDTLQEFLCSPNTQGFASVCGMEGILKQINAMFILPRHQPQLFPATTYNCLLLYGPPGCGKTQLVYALSNELNAKLYCIMPSNIMSQYVGGTEKIIQTVFETLRTQKETTILFIDEIDAFCRGRNDNELEHSRRVKIEFMHQLAVECSHSKLLVIAATNVPWDIDSAVVRRFQLKLHLGLPSAMQRSELIQFYLAVGAPGRPYDSTAMWQHLISITDGYSNSDLKELVRCALHRPIEELLEVKRWYAGTSGTYTPSLFHTANDVQCSVYDLPPGAVKAREVDLLDLINATVRISPSVSKAELDKFQTYIDKHKQL